MSVTSKAASGKHTIILPQPEKAPLHTNSIIAWMWYFLLPYKWLAITYMLYRIIRYTWISLMPIVIGFIINGFDTGYAYENPSYYSAILFGYMGVYALFLLIFVFIPEVRLTEKAIRGLTLYSINHINALPLEWHEKEVSGGKLQRVMTGRKSFMELSRHFRWDFFQLFGDFVAIILTFIIMDIPLFYLPLYLLFIVTYLLGSWYFSRPFFMLYDRFHSKFENLLAGVYEFVSAIRTVKAFHLNDTIYKRAKVLEEKGQEAMMDSTVANLKRWTICNLIGKFWLFIFAYVGFQSVLSGSLTPGAYAAVFFLAYRVSFSCEIIGIIWERLYEHGNGMYRLIETLRVRVQKMDLEPAQAMPQNWKSIKLKDVSFVYNAHENHGVRDMNIHVQRGQKIAFVGNSGAGKSTLVKLLMKQMLPQEGEITVDGVSVGHIRSGEWLSEIGFVPQDVELFNLTIRENILIDREDVDDSLLFKVLKQSALDEFVDGLPEGLNTIIGERGIKLSGGQKQRLGIARALVRQAPIMIFDEATSSLDSISEAKIQTAIENSFEDRTVFVIAHRLSTVRNVDHILVLDEGRIIEEGSFDELIKKKGHFAKLWSIQSDTEV